MSELPEYMRNFIKSVPQDKTFVKQGRLRTGWSELEWREPMAKDDLSTLDRFKDMPGRDRLIFLMCKTSEFMSRNKGNTWKERLGNSEFNFFIDVNNPYNNRYLQKKANVRNSEIWHINQAKDKQ
jgi:hypothetical protein